MKFVFELWFFFLTLFLSRPFFVFKILLFDAQFLIFVFLFFVLGASHELSFGDSKHLEKEPVIVFEFEKASQFNYIGLIAI